MARHYGVDGIQLALPFWLELRPDETLAFLRDTADVAEKTPLILYQTSRAKHKLLAEELARVAEEVPTLIGTKDTGCELVTLRAMASKTDLAIFGGDNDLVERMAAGGCGGDVGLECQKPYHSVNPAAVDSLLRWCRDHAPVLLARSRAEIDCAAASPSTTRR